MLINKLKEHLENTHIDQLRKEWEEVKEWVKVEPKAIEIAEMFNLANPFYSKGLCVSESSSGFRGNRCGRCGIWAYGDQKPKCDCDK